MDDLSNMNDNPTDKLQEDLFDGLKEHGFLFQERCAYVLKEASQKTRWRVEGEEYPVSVGAKDTRIDIVLRSTIQYSPPVEVFAVVECKRVNPTRGVWLFGKPCYPRFSEPQFINLRVGVKKFLGYNQERASLDDVAAPLVDNWWLEIGKKSSKNYASPHPIEEALTQACIGVTGIAQDIEAQLRIELPQYSALFIPVVVTTAQLYCAAYDLEDVDLKSGTIPRDRVLFGPEGQGLESVDWLLVYYGASRWMAPERLYQLVKGFGPADLASFHKRAIFVVNAAHVVKFFSRLHLV